MIIVRCSLLPPGPVLSRTALVRLPAVLHGAQQLFLQTGGLHATGLFDLDSRLVSLREDVGGLVPGNKPPARHTEEKIPWLYTPSIQPHRSVEAVIEHPHVTAVTLTGSAPAGKAVARKAGERLKKTILELGGSDAYVVLADADVEATAATCVASHLINAGQSCIAAKRFVVVDAVRREFEDAFVAQMRLAKVGDPLDEQTQVGPLARHDLRGALHQQVQASLAKGATCLLGGVVPDGQGAYYPPTMLTHVSKGMPAHDDELFGPVAAMISEAMPGAIRRRESTPPAGSVGLRCSPTADKHLLACVELDPISPMHVQVAVERPLPA